LDWSKCTHCMECSEICYAKALTAVGMRMTVEEILRIVLQDVGFYKNTGGGLTISGGEVLSNIDLALDLAKAAKSKGINVALDTSGYGKYEQLYSLAEVCDYILYDMKTIIDEKHIEMTGVSNEIILNSLVKLTKDEKLRKKIIMRMPLIRGINDDDETLAKTVKFYLKNGLTEVNLLAYHNLGISKKQNIGERPEEFEAPEDSKMQGIKKMFIDAGIHTTIMGEKQ
jgi:pyruvate formate lyase activating enzyme